MILYRSNMVEQIRWSHQRNKTKSDINYLISFVTYIGDSIGCYQYILCDIMSTYLGQNFLIDSKVKTYIQDRISKLRSLYKIGYCIEIWPGKWAITKLIYPIFKDNLKVIEKDLSMKNYLWFLDRKNIIFGDILEVDTEMIHEIISKTNAQDNKIYKDTLIYGSLPYYITSPIISKFFVDQYFYHWLFITQKERAEKVQTSAHKRSYLRWLLNNNYDIILRKIIKPRSFNPPPKIDSAIVELKYHGAKYIEPSLLVSTLDQISWYKRKTIGKILKIIKKDITIDLLGDINKKRIEELSWEDMRLLATYICK